MKKLPLRTLILLHLDFHTWKTGGELKRDINNSTLGKMGFLTRFAFNGIIYYYLQQLEEEDLVRAQGGRTSDDDLPGFKYKLTYAGDDERQTLLATIANQ